MVSEGLCSFNTILDANRKFQLLPEALVALSVYLYAYRGAQILIGFTIVSKLL